MGSRKSRKRVEYREPVVENRKEAAAPMDWSGTEMVVSDVLKCPHCGSVRSRCLWTEPLDGGDRIAYRRCRGCLSSFRVLLRSGG
jgi:transcription elongation factor Elf1